MASASAARELGELVSADPADLPGEHGSDQRDVDAQPQQRAPVTQVAEGQDVVRTEDDDPRDGDGEHRPEKSSPSCSPIQVGEAERDDRGPGFGRSRHQAYRVGVSTSGHGPSRRVTRAAPSIARSRPTSRPGHD